MTTLELITEPARFSIGNDGSLKVRDSQPNGCLEMSFRYISFGNRTFELVILHYLRTLS